MTTLRCVTSQPLSNGALIKVDKNPFPELLNRGQPVRVLRQRGPTHRELNILEVPVGTGRRCLEAREAVEARNFAQPVDGNYVLDGRQIHAGGRSGPDVAG